MEIVADHHTLEVEALRADFPVLSREVRPGVPLIYLDSAASSQKPRTVLQAMDDFYARHYANIHRGIHTLAEEATAMYEQARGDVARFVNAARPEEIVFTRNTTEAINLVANAWGRAFLKAGDLVILTEMEHHSNLVPWQMLVAERGWRLEFIEVTPEGLLDGASYERLLTQGPKLVSFTHVSNVLGTLNPAKEIIAQAHAAGAVAVLDAAQSVPHMPVDVQELDVDFMAFSGHKMLGPTGIGVLYAKLNHLEAMPPFLGGGDMIKRVYLRSFRPNDVPHKFEAGTPAIAEAIGLGAAVDYLSCVGLPAIRAHEQEMTAYAIERLEEVPEVRLLGPSAEKKGGVVAFEFSDVHPHDVAQVLDRYGIAVRAGHHCAMPLHDKFGITASTRASFYLYNTKPEVDRLVEGLYKVKELFA